MRTSVSRKKRLRRERKKIVTRMHSGGQHASLGDTTSPPRLRATRMAEHRDGSPSSMYEIRPMRPYARAPYVRVCYSECDQQMVSRPGRLGESNICCVCVCVCQASMGCVVNVAFRLAPSGARRTDQVICWHGARRSQPCCTSVGGKEMRVHMAVVSIQAGSVTDWGMGQDSKCQPCLA